MSGGAAALLAAGGWLAACGTAPVVRDWGANASPAGLSLTLTEVARARTADGTDVALRVEARGVPRGAALRLWVRRWGGSPAIVPGVYVNDAGVLVTAQAGTESQLHAVGLARGEPYEAGIVSPDGAARAFARTVPLPVQAAGAGACRVRAELGSLKGDAWIVSGEGFTPREEINAVLKSGEDEHLETFLADAEGRFSRTTFPAVHFKRREGEAVYTVVGAACKLELPLTWGPKALRAG